MNSPDLMGSCRRVITIAALTLLGCGGGGEDAWIGDFSPDGSKIAYSELITATQGNIVVADSDGSNPIVVYSWQAPDERGGGLGAPAWSPDGLQIIFQIRQGFGTCQQADSDSYVVGVDGTGFAKLLDSECGSGNFKPTFSPDGTRIAFSSKRARGGGPTLSDLDIFLMNADGSDVQQLTDGLDSGTSPVWAPDGNRILFGANTAAQLWVLDLEEGAGVPEKIFELPGALFLEPGAWSPDGSKIYLTVWWDGFGADVHVLDLESGQLTALTTEKDTFDGNVRINMAGG